MPRTCFTDRRSVLQLAAAAATTLWIPRSAWSQARMAADPFTLGVASGSPDATSVVLWTRLAPGEALAQAPVTVRWEIAHDDAFRQIAASGQSPALPELAHSVHVEASGLAPDRWYFYRFMVGEWTSPVGRTRTLPAPDAPVQKLRIGYASCQRWEHGYYAAWRHLLDEQPDLVLFLGDYIYEYPGAAGAVRRTDGITPTDLGQYRARYALHKSDPDLQRMHAACPWFFTWDDHEVENDYAGETSGTTVMTGAAFLRRRAAAYQACYEHMPLRASVLTRGAAGLADGAETRVYSRHRLGKLADLYLLDARQYRDRQVCNPGDRFGSSTFDPATCAALSDPKRTLLGTAQEQWLDTQLASAGTQWNVIGQSTLFGPRDFSPGPGRMIWNDGWDGYPAARQRLAQSLEKHRVPNAVLLGGDVHENWVGHVKADYARTDSATLGVEFCGTSITSRSGRTAEQTAAVLAENPHFVFADSLYRGYCVADFTPKRMDVRLRGVEHVTQRDSGIRTIAGFAVEAGRAAVEKA